MKIYQFRFIARLIANSAGFFSVILLSICLMERSQLRFKYKRPYIR